MTAVPTPPGDELDLDKLEALAKKATPGPWRKSPHCIWSGEREPGPFGGGGFVAQTYNDRPIHKNEIANAKYIAAANPATVLALLARIKALRAEIDQIAYARDEYWRASEDADRRAQHAVNDASDAQELLRRELDRAEREESDRVELQEILNRKLDELDEAYAKIKAQDAEIERLREEVRRT